ncbi:MAG: phosphatidate cytidylyltransferase, partial [Gammaproteobacteria bacterium]
MLKQRIITAIFLLGLLYAVIYLLPIRYFSWAVGVVVLLGAWEWAALSGLKNPILRIGYLLLFVFLYFMINQLPVYDAIKMMSGMAVLWWMWSIVWLLRFQRQVQIIQRNTYVFSMIGILVLLPFWYAIVMLNLEQTLNPQAGQVLLLVIILVALADTSAYFFGKSFGKHKLASRISPGKSWEGLFGAVFTVTFLVWPLANILNVHAFNHPELMGLA